MKIEDRLFKVRYKRDTMPHLAIKDAEVCANCPHKPCLNFCPAQVYEWDEEKKLINVAWEGCLECGTCRIGCPFANIEWKYPRGGFGIAYKFG